MVSHDNRGEEKKGENDLVGFKEAKGILLSLQGKRCSYYSTEFSSGGVRRDFTVGPWKHAIPMTKRGWKEETSLTGRAPHWGKRSSSVLFLE